MYPNEPQDSQPIAGMPMESMEQINELLITGDWKSNKLSVPVPKFCKEEMFVLETDKQGNVFRVKDKDGFVYKKIIIKKFDEWTNKTIDLPVDEVFNTSFITGDYDPIDIDLLNGLLDLYWFVIQMQLVTKEDHSMDLFKIKQTIGNIVFTSKGKAGATMRMVKTNISKGESIQTWIQKQQMEEEKRRRLWGLLPK